MTTATQDNHIDLEKELTCSICTGILYQPLTLLDCLHTFCGACLKEWFAFQASTATSLHPYTCPSCRASVRDTRPNASYNTLLDMFLQVNPGRGKTEQEKAEDREKYKPGSNVLPRLRPRRRVSEEGRERRQVEEARVQSLRDAGVASSRLAVSLRDGSSGDRSRERRDGERRSQSASREASIISLSQPVALHQAPERQIEHQASIRSLLSTSDVDSEEMADRIMRQIADEGLLEGIDLETIDIDQEDALSERIAQAYRRRMEESRRRRRAVLAAQRAPHIDDAGSSRAPSSNPVAHGAQTTSSEPTQPPEASEYAGPPNATSRQTRATVESGDRPSSHSRLQARPSGSPDPPTNPAVDMSPSEVTPTRPSHQVPPGGTRERRMSHESGHPRSLARNRGRSLSQSGSTLSRPAVTSGLTPQHTDERPLGRQVVPPGGRSPRSNAATFPITPNFGYNRSTPSLALPNNTTLFASSETNRSSSSSSATRAAAPVFKEPLFSCDRCGKANIQYSLHYNCHRCKQGNYNICSRCYRTGRGCLHWFGFGWRAPQAYAGSAPPGGYPPNEEGPHTLTGRKFRKPVVVTQQNTGPTPNAPRMTTDDPASRLEAGAFCECCSKFANACYWKCNVCNDGDWGFCNQCVNQGRHCTHPLLPLMHQRTVRQQRNDTESGDSPKSADLACTPPTSPSLTPRTASVVRSPTSVIVAGSVFKPLTFSTDCDICRYPIPPSRTRFHCPKCNDGDYDICSSCYISLVSRGAIKAEDGHQGWRRCFKGHRMIVVGFEDRDGGQWRKVVNDLVGGHALDEDEVFRDGLPPAIAPAPNPASSPPQDREQDSIFRDDDGTVRRRVKKGQPPQGTTVSRLAAFPPDGGEGFQLQATWSYFPADNVTDELSFPRGAEIREAEDINGDWYAGVYCGRLGLLPSGYVVVRGST